MRSIILISYLLFVSGTLLYSQKVLYKKDVPKSSLSQYEEGVSLYKQNQYQKAIIHFEKALKKSPGFIDAELQWASVCFDLKDYACAEKHFETVLKLDTGYNHKVYFTLALTQYQLDHFQKADQNISAYLKYENTNPDLRLKAATLSKYIHFADSATRNPEPVIPVSLQALNSDFSEYLPTVTADGRTVVFTRRNFRDDEDLYISFMNDSTWTEAMPIQELNTPQNEGSPALSQDGTLLIFTICNDRFSLGGCDLYLSELKDGSWTEPYNMGEKVNTAAYESNACFAENGNVIYFCSNRKGTLGGYDIWMSRRKADRSWSIPKNLGALINTPGNEVSPYMHPNGNTLYFSSDYHPGMGGRDLFYSIADKNGNWQPPINLGYPINSKGDESSFIVFPDGIKAWMASDKKSLKESRPNLDLYEMILPASLKTKPSTYVSITVTDKTTGKPVIARVSIFNLSDNKKFYDNQVNTSGKILIALPTGADYGMHIYHKDYLFYSGQFSTTIARKQYDPLILIKKLDRLNELTTNTTVLKNIFFESGSAILRKESEFELDGLIKFLNDNPTIKLKITGHTDNIGTESDNLILSLNRAQAVVDFLKLKGIQTERLMYEGKGESIPVDTNETEEGRQNNRRIEFIIVR